VEKIFGVGGKRLEKNCAIDSRKKGSRLTVKRSIVGTGRKGGKGERRNGALFSGHEKEDFFLGEDAIQGTVKGWRAKEEGTLPTSEKSYHCDKWVGGSTEA